MRTQVIRISGKADKVFKLIYELSLKYKTLDDIVKGGKQ